MASIASYAVLDEHFLEFGNAHPSEFAIEPDPQIGLQKYGPYSLKLNHWHPNQTTIIPISSDDEFNDVVGVLGRLNKFERVEEPNWYVRTDFPGYEQTYRSKLIIETSKKQTIPRDTFDKALAERNPRDGFEMLMNVLLEIIDECSKDALNAILAIHLPKDIVIQFRTLTPDFRPAKPKKKKQQKTKDGMMQMFLFGEIEDADEFQDSLYHNLRRAIKVRAMQRGVAIQILTDSFLTEEPSQPWAGKFWNICNSIFCKAGGVPWRLPRNENIAHCGIRFGISKDQSGTNILVGVAQVFSSSGELVAIRTGQANRGKRKSEAGYFLNESQAFDLISNAIKDYELVTGKLPDRMLVHKSSIFKEEEIDGIEAAKGGVREIDLVYIKQRTSVRLLPAGGQPAIRGTVVPSSDNSALLYLTGLITQERSWRGKHIPSPMEIVRCKSNRSLLDLADETLCLTKMDWNTTVFATRQPCTFANAVEMIGMMKELKKGEVLRPQLRYYI